MPRKLAILLHVAVQFAWCATGRFEAGRYVAAARAELQKTEGVVEGFEGTAFKGPDAWFERDASNPFRSRDGREAVEQHIAGHRCVSVKLLSTDRDSTVGEVWMFLDADTFEVLFSLHYE